MAQWLNVRLGLRLVHLSNPRTRRSLLGRETDVKLGFSPSFVEAIILYSQAKGNIKGAVNNIGNTSKRLR